MYDESLLLQTLSRFASNLVRAYDMETVLVELTEAVTATLGLAGSGVNVRKNDELLYVTAVNAPVADLEQISRSRARVLATTRTAPALPS